MQLAHDHGRDEPGRDGEHVSSVRAAPGGEHSQEEDPEHGTQNESGDAEDDRNDSQVWVRDLRIGEPAGDNDHEHGEEDREPAGDKDVVRLASATNPPNVPVVRGARRQSVERRREGAHGGGEDASQHETPDAHRHHVHDIGPKDVRRGLWPIGGVLLVVDEEQDTDEHEG